MATAKVSIAQTGGNIQEGLFEAVNLLGGLEQYIGHQDTVMLKPNLNDEELVTNIALTKSLIGWLKDYGVARISVAESTFGNAQRTEMLFRKSGYTELCRKYGIQLCNLNRSEAVEVTVQNPLVAANLKIAREVWRPTGLSISRWPRFIMRPEFPWR